MIVTFRDGTKEDWPIGCATLGKEIMSFEITAEEVARAERNGIEVSTWLFYSVFTRFGAT